MTKATVFSVSTVLVPAVILISGAMAQQAKQAKPAAAARTKPAGPVLPKVAKVTVNHPVTLTDNGDTWTMDNGIVKVTIIKKIGSLQQVVYHGVETLQPSVPGRVGCLPHAADARRQPRSRPGNRFRPAP